VRERPPAPRIVEAGDAALMLEVGEGIEEAVNARAIAIAALMRRHQIPGVRDVVSTFRSVVVYFDPLATDVGAVAGALHDADDAPVPEPEGNRIEVPAVYGGEAGPVARFARGSPQSVIDRHASGTYRVFMLGFLPGFAYMASVDEAIAAPRRATPRLRVAPGSVGIAGRQTGIYPQESPGGWQIIGRTPLAVFDPERTPPALFAPGDLVRFVPIAVSEVSNPNSANPTSQRAPAAADARRDSGVGHRDLAATRSITIIRPGLLTTVQDSGRWGHQDRGVPVSGAMDLVSHRLANALVGNPPDAATLEATMVGPEVRIDHDATMAVSGADLRATVNGSDVPMHVPLSCRAGSVLRFGERRTGARAYVAFDGGLAVAPALGSRATHVRSRLGGVAGRALWAGDRIPLGPPAGPPVRRRPPDGAEPRTTGGARLRILPGPQADHFSTDALDVLQRVRFTISSQSDRMGYRLTGDATLLRAIGSEMVSDAAFLGGVQIPPSGAPILLMADRQTTGGYPQIAIVITADVPVAAQLAPGDWVEFTVCTRRDAMAALVAQEGRLLALR